MSIRVQSIVWTYAPYKGACLLVLLSLADWAGDDGGRVFPTLSTLAKKSRLCVRATRNCLRRLENDGVISKVRVATGCPGQGTEYRIVVEQLQRMDPDLNPEDDAPPNAAERRHKSPPSTAADDDTKGGISQRRGRQLATQTAASGNRYIDNHQGNHQEIQPADPPAPARDGADGRQALALEPYLQGIEKLFGWRLWDVWFAGAGFYRESDSTLIAVDKALNRNMISGRYLPRLERLFGSSIRVLLKSELEGAA